MDKNPLINIRPKIKDKIIKDENFSNSDNHPLQLPLKSVKGPALNFDKKKLLKTPKIIKTIRINEKTDYLASLEKSVRFFLNTVIKKKYFSQKENSKSLAINKMII